MNNWRWQGIRFGIVGLVSNALLYLLYLLLVNLGVDPKLVVTILYILGLSSTFIFNKRWSFSHQGDWSRSGVRYVSLYGGLYLTNILVLLLLVDLLELPHAFVQAGVVLVFIPVVFLMQRYWVFAKAL
jgi:putative flippase GtrA